MLLCECSRVRIECVVARAAERDALQIAGLLRGSMWACMARVYQSRRSTGRTGEALYESLVKRVADRLLSFVDRFRCELESLEHGSLLFNI